MQYTAVLLWKENFCCSFVYILFTLFTFDLTSPLSHSAICNLLHSQSCIVFMDVGRYCQLNFIGPKDREIVHY